MKRVSIVLFLLAGLGLSINAAAQRQVPLATEADAALAPLQVSRDGTEVEFRSVAPDKLRICVAPATGRFGPRRCFTVGDVRSGRVGLNEPKSPPK